MSRELAHGRLPARAADGRSGWSFRHPLLAAVLLAALHAIQR